MEMTEKEAIREIIKRIRENLMSMRAEVRLLKTRLESLDNEDYTSSAWGTETNE